MPTISLCMNVYNEENNIRRCLDSAKKIVDEVIIVDTGSTDLTKSICDEYDVQIFDYKWGDDFSKARNYSLSKASCDWILLLDADEELKIHNSHGLREYLQNTVHDFILVRMTHFYGNEPVNEKRAHFSGSLRLIRNDGTLRFAGKIHERIDVGNRSVDYTADTRSFIQILHYGYLEEASQSKPERNISLLQKEMEEQTDNPWLKYYLAAEYFRIGKFLDAYREANTAIAIFIGKGVLPPSLSYKLKYDLLITTGYFDLAYNSIGKAVELYPDYVDLHFYKGLLQYNHKEYEKALDTFSYCLVLGESNIDYLILSGSGSFLPLYYIGLCYEKQGKFEQSAEAFRQAERLCPEIRSEKQSYRHIDLFSGEQ